MRKSLSIVFVGLSGLVLFACGGNGNGDPFSGTGGNGGVILTCATLEVPPPDCDKACTSDSQCEASFCQNSKCVAQLHRDRGLWCGLDLQHDTGPLRSQHGHRRYGRHRQHGRQRLSVGHDHTHTKHSERHVPGRPEWVDDLPTFGAVSRNDGSARAMQGMRSRGIVIRARFDRSIRSDHVHLRQWRLQIRLPTAPGGGRSFGCQPAGRFRARQLERDRQQRRLSRAATPTMRRAIHRPATASTRSWASSNAIRRRPRVRRSSCWPRTVSRTPASVPNPGAVPDRPNAEAVTAATAAHSCGVSTSSSLASGPSKSAHSTTFKKWRMSALARPPTKAAIRHRSGRRPRLERSRDGVPADHQRQHLVRHPDGQALRRQRTRLATT